MKAKVSGIGAEPKKLAMLGGLVLVALYFYFSNRAPSGPASPSSPVASVRTSAEAPVPLNTSARLARSRARQKGAAGTNFLEFHPSLKPKGEPDRASIDPTLRLELLEKLQDVKIEGGNRSLFESATAAAAQIASVEPKRIVPTFGYQGPPAPPSKVDLAKVEGPPPPPVPLKFYGFINPARVGAKRAFFLDGEDIIVATEGQLIKNRYKIVRIGINSADVEDTQFKNHRQTLPLVEEQS